ncbi:MAG: hypothetical protein ACFFE2_06215 [Candidatus Thorarchaeota archaeon]
MNDDEDTFFEDDDYDEEDEEEEDSFPDDEYEDDEDYDSIDALYDTGEGRFANFAEDPWPPTTFILILIGLFIVLLTPPPLWALWNYFIISDYFMMIIGGAAAAYSIVAWHRAGQHRLRWAAVTNLFVVLLIVVITTIDTFSWVFYLRSIFPGVETPILPLALVLAVFSIYSLWVIQRNFAQPTRR